MKKLDSCLKRLLSNISSLATILKRFFLSPGLIAGTVCVFATNILLAANGLDTWDGSSGADFNWGTAGNWAGGSANAPPVTGDTLAFGGTTGLNNTNNLAAGTQFNGIFFNSGAGAFNLFGSSITLAGSITNNSSSLQTINFAITNNLNNTLNDEGGGIVISNSISGTGGLTNAGSGTVYLDTKNSFTGGAMINNGTLQINAGASGSGNQNGGLARNCPVIVNPSGTLIGGAGDSFGYGSDSSGITINGGTVTDLGTANYDITLPNVTFIGGILTSAAGNAGSGGFNFACNGNGTLCTITTRAANTTAIISATGLGIERPITFNVAAGNVTGGSTPGVDLLVSSFVAKDGGHAGIITKTGAGTLEFSGTTNNFSVGLAINGGVIRVGAPQSSSGPLGSSSDAISFGGGTLQYSPVNNYDYSHNFSTAASQEYSIDVAGQNVTYATALSSVGGSLTLNDSVGGGTLTLSAANTYSGATVINGGTLLVNGSLASGSSVSIGTGGLGGSGTVNGSVTTTNSGAQINQEVYDDMEFTVGTLAVGGNLNMSSGGSCCLDVSTSHSSGNDLITVGGTLTLNNNTFHINALSGSAALDANGDYVLIQGSSPVLGTVNATPVWDGTPPSNNGNYSVKISGDNVVLHNNAFSGFEITAATASPTKVSRYQSALLSVAVTNGIAPYTITVDASSVGGSSSLGLVQDTSQPAGVYIYTNSITPSAGTALGGYSLPVNATDSTTPTPQAASGSIPLTMAGASLVWNGDASGNSYWGTSGQLEWKNGETYMDGDFARFDDTAMEPNFTNVDLLTSLSPGNVVVNNSACNYFFTDNGTYSGAIYGSGSLTKQGSGTLTLAEGGGDSFSGGIVVSNGTLILADYGSTISGGVIINSGATLQISTNDVVGNLPSGAMIDNGTLAFDRSDNPYFASAVITGSGGISQISSGNLELSGANTFTGNIAVTNGTLTDDNFNNAGTSGGLGASVSGRTITVGSGAILNSLVQNWFGGNTVAAANLPSIIINGGTATSTRYGTVGNLTLNNGATLTATNTTDTGSYQGYQFLGSVTVGGALPSTITSGNGKSDELGSNTVFNVAATSGSGADLTVNIGLQNQSGDFSTAPGGLTKTGAGTMLLMGTNTYTGNTIINAGTLALSGSSSISNSPTIVIAGGALLDVSALSPFFGLASSQTLSNSTSTAIINGPADLSAGKVALSYSGASCLMVTNGTLNLASGTAFTINNTSPALTAGSYPIISTATSGNVGSVIGAAPSSVTVGGAGITLGATASLSISNNELYLVVTGGIMSRPVITGITLHGTTLNITATNGTDNQPFVLLGSTNVALPLNQWTPLLTNNFNGSGNLNLSTNIVSPNNVRQFYILSQ